MNLGSAYGDIRISTVDASRQIQVLGGVLRSAGSAMASAIVGPLASVERSAAGAATGAQLLGRQLSSLQGLNLGGLAEQFELVFRRVTSAASDGFRQFVGALASQLQAVRIEVPRFDWADWMVAFPGWERFVSMFVWPTLPSFSWSSWISAFRWPVLPAFSWSSWIGAFVWPAVSWPGWSAWIPSFSWPSIPSFPGWGAFVSGINVGRNEFGTQYWQGGMTWVGESGPELVELPRGARVHDAAASAQMAGGTNIENHYHVYNDLDVEVVARRVLDVMRRHA